MYCETSVKVDVRFSPHSGLLEGYALAEKMAEATKLAKNTYSFCVRKCKDRVAEIIKLQVVTSARVR